MTGLIGSSRDNLWSVTIVQRASGLVTILPVAMPLELHNRLVAFLERELKCAPSHLS